MHSWNLEIEGLPHESQQDIFPVDDGGPSFAHFGTKVSHSMAPHTHLALKMLTQKSLPC